MNLYTVVYTRYANETKTVMVVAKTARHAFDGAKAVMRSRHDPDREIVSIAKVSVVDKVVA